MYYLNNINLFLLRFYSALSYDISTEQIAIYDNRSLNMFLDDVVYIKYKLTFNITSYHLKCVILSFGRISQLNTY